MGIASDLVYIIVAGLIGGVCAHLLRQPLILGYLLAGVMVGPYTGGVTVQNIHHIEMLAEIGVALLLFALGLEFSFSKFKGLLPVILAITPLQLLLTSVLGYYLLGAYHFNSTEAIWIGTAISLSSTMFVIKTFSVGESLSGSLGRILLAVLIAQDLAVVPMMLLLPQITGDLLLYSSILLALLKSTLFLAGLFYAGTRVFPRLFALVARQGSRELFLLFTLSMALGVGFISHEIGLSFALGAFVAGMLISESDFSHQALSDVSNLRDLFSLIFFVSIGMLLDPALYLSEPWMIVTLALLVICIKCFITSGLFFFYRSPFSVVMTAGLGLSQIGEFAFVVLKTGNLSGFVSNRSFSIVIAVAVLTMLATPILFKMARLSSKIVNKRKPDNFEGIDPEIVDLKEHVIIVGAGVVGLYVTKVLASLGKGYVTVEADHTVFTSLRDRGIKAIFGDATSVEVLRAAGIEQAKLILVATKEDKILPAIVSSIKRIRDDIPVVLRVEDIDELKLSLGLDIREIVHPQMETALEMVHQALLALGLGEAEVFSILGHLRADRYELKGGLLREILSSDAGGARSLGRLKAASRLFNLAWLEVDETSDYFNKPLGQLKIREELGVSVIGILRKDEFIPTPSPDMQIKLGDQLGLIGSESQIRKLQISRIRQ